MPRKSRKDPVETSALYIFEITDWETLYQLSVNGHRDEDGAYSEITLLTLQTICRYPKRLVGRTARFDLYGEREFLEPHEWKRDRDWRPRDVAHLELPPSGGRCYARLPHDSLVVLMTALGHQRLRYASLRGPPLVRGSAMCRTIGFSYDEGLDEDETDSKAVTD
jgi:hypothetical protein